MRRSGWSLTRGFLEGIETREGRELVPGERARIPRRPGWRGGGGANTGTFQAVVDKVKPVSDRHPGEEFPFLRDHAHVADQVHDGGAELPPPLLVGHRLAPWRTRSCEEFLTDIRDWLHEIASWLVAQGCGYIQLDAPNYGSLCDPENRAWHAEQGHDLDAEVAFDARARQLGLRGPRRHPRAPRLPGQRRLGRLALLWRLRRDRRRRCSPRLDMDVVLLEYDSDRAGDFAPLAHVKPGTVAVLGLLSTKAAALEDER